MVGQAIVRGVISDERAGALRCTPSSTLGPERSLAMGSSRVERGWDRIRTGVAAFANAISEATRVPSHVDATGFEPASRESDSRKAALTPRVRALGIGSGRGYRSGRSDPQSGRCPRIRARVFGCRPLEPVAFRVAQSLLPRSGVQPGKTQFDML